MAPVRRPTALLPLVAAAILVGILTGFGLSSTGFSVKVQFLAQSLPALVTLGDEVVSLNETHPPITLSPEELELNYLSNMVAKTDGFYARDYSLWLGWNNMRYIIETALLHGRILNRTTVIPSFVYARACEFDLDTCAAYAEMVNRGDAVESDEWRDLPMKQQMAWRIPISLMFNLTHLQQTHAVITTSDYLRLHNISTDLETGKGNWDVDTYHVHDADGGLGPSLHVIENEWYDPDDFVRVDYLPPDMRIRGNWSSEGGDDSRGQVGSWHDTTSSELYNALNEAVPSERPILTWKTVTRIVSDGDRITAESSPEEIGDVLRENGFEVIYTYDGAGGTDFVKDVITPLYEAVPRRRMRGLYEDFRNITERVLLLPGEVHLGRKPVSVSVVLLPRESFISQGSLYFTSGSARSRYSQTVLYDMRLSENVLALAERINNRMLALNNGRLWMSAHMRRGDFARLGWAMEMDFRAHLARIQRHLHDGRDILIAMHGGSATTYDVPRAEPDPLTTTLDPPEPDDKYYIATDERNLDNLDYLREQGAILITELLTKEDRREFGWPILLTDVLALVEQATLSHAAYFYAHAFSSVAGGVMNLRAGLGKDPRTAYLD